MKNLFENWNRFINERRELISENVQFPVDAREIEIEANKLDLANRKERGGPSDTTINALQQAVGEDYMVVDYGNDEGYQTFSAIEQGKMDLPDGKKGAIIVVPNGVFTAEDGKVIVHFKTIRDHKYGRAELPK